MKIIMILIMLFVLGCAPSIQYPIKRISAVCPLVENKYEIAGKEIYEGMYEN